MPIVAPTLAADTMDHANAAAANSSGVTPHAGSCAWKKPHPARAFEKNVNYFQRFARFSEVVGDFIHMHGGRASVKLVLTNLRALVSGSTGKEAGKRVGLSPDKGTVR